MRNQKRYVEPLIPGKPRSFAPIGDPLDAGSLTAMSWTTFSVSLLSLGLCVLGVVAFGMTVHYNQQVIKQIVGSVGIGATRSGPVVTVENLKIIQAGAGIGVSIVDDVTTVSNARSVVAGPGLLSVVTVGNDTTIHGSSLTERLATTTGGSADSPCVTMQTNVTEAFVLDTTYSISTWSAVGLTGKGAGLSPSGVGSWSVPYNGLYQISFSPSIVSTGVAASWNPQFVAGFNCASPTSVISCQKSLIFPNIISAVAVFGSGSPGRVQTLQTHGYSFRVCPTCEYNVGDALTVYYGFYYGAPEVSEYRLNVRICQVI